MILVYKTDAAHSFASRDLIGISETMDGAFELCQLQAFKEGEILTDDQWCKTQSQWYDGEGEFDTEEVELNTLL